MSKKSPNETEKNPNILGILPVRKGSKGLPGKNIMLFRGKPLLTWSAEAISKAKLIKNKIISTDCSQMASLGVETGLEFYGLRPAFLADDNAKILDVIDYELENAENKNQVQYEYIVLVQATSPGVTHQLIEKCINLAIDRNAATVFTCFKVKTNGPEIMFKIDDKENVHWLKGKSKTSGRRQEFSETYCRSGLVYVFSRENIKKHKQLYVDPCLHIEVPYEVSVNIDNFIDYKIALAILPEVEND